MNILSLKDKIILYIFKKKKEPKIAIKRNHF